MPPVTLNANDPGNPHPNPVPCTGSDQTITWNLVPHAAAFAAQPIDFPDPPPAGYDRWPGSAVTVNGHFATAQVNKQIGGGRTERYKYTVYLANGQEFDPEVQNTGTGLGGPGPTKP